MPIRITNREFAYSFLIYCIMILNCAEMAFSLGSHSLPFQQLEVQHTVAPAIPRLVIATGISTEVVIDLEIDAKGSVTSARIINGHPLLRSATKEASLQWRFAPASDSFRKVRLTFIYEKQNWNLDIAVRVLPFQISLKPRLLPPPDTIIYIPENFQAGEDRCEIHNEILKEDRVEIIYGLVLSEKGNAEDKAKLFPNSNQVAFGGCVIGPDSPKYAKVIYCQVCRDTERKRSK